MSTTSSQACVCDPGHQASLQILFQLFPSHVLVPPVPALILPQLLFPPYPLKENRLQRRPLGKARHQREVDGQRCQTHPASLRSACVV